MPKKIGVLTGGGDVPGLNPAIKAVVTMALNEGNIIYGIRRGWAGLLEYNFDDPESYRNIFPLGYEDVRRIDRSGGTFLHSSRTNPQKVKTNVIPEFLKGSPLGIVIDEETVDFTPYILKVLDHFNIDTLVTIGGDDTLSYSVRLNEEGVSIIAIPKTMDNDVFGTEYCIGFSTSITRAIEVINNMRTSLGSHERIGVIELFGRNSGETSLTAAYLSGADRAVIPEVHFNIDTLTDYLVHERLSNPSHYSRVTVSEGAIMEGGDVYETGEMDAYGHRKLGGIGIIVADAIKKRSKVDTMYQQIGYMMRSGAPDSLDRMVALSFGTLAGQMLRRNEVGRMVAIHGGKYTTVPIKMVVSGIRRVDVAAFYDIVNYRPHIKDVLGVPMFLS